MNNSNNQLSAFFRKLLAINWKPNYDLLAVGVSWILVVGSMYAATFLIGTKALGGMGYFLAYGILAALIFGFCLPVGWMYIIRKKSIASLGITSRNLLVSIIIQVVLSAVQFILISKSITLPTIRSLIPLLFLALSIGLFEAVYWRGWVQQRIENSFGVIPGIVIASALYALYHIGYGMPWSEIRFLFLIGLMFAIVFRITNNIFVLWPLFQPMGQLITLIKDKLELPLISSLGFIDILVAIIVITVIVARLGRKKKYSA